MFGKHVISPILRIGNYIIGNFIVFVTVSNYVVVIIWLPQWIQFVEFWDFKIIFINKIVNLGNRRRFEPSYK